MNETSLETTIHSSELLFLNNAAFANAMAGENGIRFIVMDLDVEGKGIMHIAMTMDEFRKFLHAAEMTVTTANN